MLVYRSVRPARDVLVVQKMRELARQYPRFGYRMIRIFLGRAGHAMNPKRTYRLWAVWQACSCHGSGLGAELPIRAPVRNRQRDRTTSGRKTSCSIAPVPDRT